MSGEQAERSAVRKTVGASPAALLRSVGSRTRMASVMLALCAFMGAASSACGGPARPPTTVSMRMTGAPGSATVTIDDIFVGALDVVAARGVALPPGVHHVTVEAPGYLPWDKEIEAKEGEGPVKLDVRLAPIPD